MLLIQGCCGINLTYLLNYYDLYCSLPPRSDRNLLASFLGDVYAHRFRWSGLDRFNPLYSMAPSMSWPTRHPHEEVKLEPGRTYMTCWCWIFIHQTDLVNLMSKSVNVNVCKGGSPWMWSSVKVESTWLFWSLGRPDIHFTSPIFDPWLWNPLVVLADGNIRLMFWQILSPSWK